MNEDKRAWRKWIVLLVASFIGVAVISAMCLLGYIIYYTVVTGGTTTVLKIKHSKKGHEFWIQKIEPSPEGAIYLFILSADGKRRTQSCGWPKFLPAGTKPTTAKWLEEENRIVINFENGQATYLSYDGASMDAAASSAEPSFYLAPSFSKANPSEDAAPDKSL